MRFSLCLLLCSLSVKALALSPHIHVDQFGYLPDAEKIAVISNPKKGFNAGQSFTPAARYEVRRADNDKTVFQAALTPWNNGKTHADSGDQVWWFDFSQLDTAGDYYVYDPDNRAASALFRIGPNVYWEVLRQAVRTFFYQRIGQAKTPPFADQFWADGASHSGPEQDSLCYLIRSANPKKYDPATRRDLSGGWFDAGDYNKYINYADSAVHNLLFAFEENPHIWQDTYDIPESGNGIPDLLDEIKYELDWMLRMQLDDGSVLHKVSSINWDSPSPPSSDHNIRRYAPATASATISAAGAFAHAANIYQHLPSLDMQAYARRLRQAAVKAWDWLEANPGKIPSKYNNAGFITVSAEDPPERQRLNRVAAAFYLYVLTRDERYQNYLEQRAEKDAPFLANDPSFFEGEELGFDGGQAEIQNAMLYYALAAPEQRLGKKIFSLVREAMQHPYASFSPLRDYLEQTDAYRAYLYYHSWGSNRAKSQAGNVLMSMITSGLATPEERPYYRNAASGFLHYLHGVNPLSLVYLSNMQRYGAELSIAEFYHLWFRDRSLWDNAYSSFGPPPGFLVGGVNMNYSQSGVYIGDVKKTSHLVKNQPTLKKFKAWNTVEDAAYELTENSITYQAAYIRLLSKFIPAGPKPPTTPIADLEVNGLQVKVSWNATDAERYTLFYAPFPHANPIGQLSMGGQQQLNITLWPGAAFFVVLQAHNRNGNSGFSSPLFFEVKG